MKYTVTRNGALLGRVYVMLPSTPELVVGLLHWAPGEAEPRETTQVTHPFLPGAPTYEFFDDVPRDRVTTLEKLSPEEAEGIASERKLELRDADGGVIPTRMLSIRRSDASYRARSAEACARAGVPMSGWEVVALPCSPGTDRTSCGVTRP